jgi:geranylgeranyl diphosphate synthase type I
MKQNHIVDMSEQLAHYKALIDKALNERLGKYLATLQKPDISPADKEAAQLLVKFAQNPGKRLRGALAWYTYENMAKKPNPDTGANLAVAMELIQDYLLIIDDVMDRSEKRRGQPTIHQTYLSRLSKYVQDDCLHLANMMAVNIGCLAQHLANSFILECLEPAENLKNALTILHDNIKLTCYGQIDDLMSVYSPTMPSVDTIYSIYRAKSSYYTFINPIQMGAAMAGCYDEKLMQDIIAFGRPAGLAFQIKDDILGMFGNSQETGKPNLDDLREGKRTLLVTYAMQMSNPSQKAEIKKHLGNSKLTKNNFLKVRKIIETCGAKDKTEQEAINNARQAVKLLGAASTIKPEMQTFYSAIIEFSVNRKA